LGWACAASLASWLRAAAAADLHSAVAIVQIGGSGGLSTSAPGDYAGCMRGDAGGHAFACLFSFADDQRLRH
jgi:hypothetical protein